MRIEALLQSHHRDQSSIYNNDLLSESEVFTGKSRAETLPNCPSSSKVNKVRPIEVCDFPIKNETFEVKK